MTCFQHWAIYSFFGPCLGLPRRPSLVALGVGGRRRRASPADRRRPPSSFPRRAPAASSASPPPSPSGMDHESRRVRGGTSPLDAAVECCEPPHIPVVGAEVSAGLALLVTHFAPHPSEAAWSTHAPGTHFAVIHVPSIDYS